MLLSLSTIAENCLLLSMLLIAERITFQFSSGLAKISFERLLRMPRASIIALLSFAAKRSLITSVDCLCCVKHEMSRAVKGITV